MSKLDSLEEINFQKLFESIPGRYLALSTRFIIIGATDSYLEMSLKKREEILGKNIFEVFPENPNDPNADGINRLTKSLNRVLSEKKSDSMDIFKYDLTTNDNGFITKYWKTINSPVFNDTGELLYILHQPEDITELINLKEKEKKQDIINQELKTKSDSIQEEFNEIARELKPQYKLKDNLEISLKQSVREVESERVKMHSLLNNAPAYISLLEGPEHLFTFTNPLYQKLINDRPVIGKTIREAWPELEGQGFYELLDKVYTTGEPHIGNETPALINTGHGNLEQRYMNFVYQPVFDIDNKVSGISAYVHDVTEQVLARQKLETITKELLESEAKYKKLAESLEIKVQERTAELYAERNRFNSLFRNAPTGITFLRGEDHIYEFANPAYQQIIATSKSILGKPLKEAFPELTGQGIVELYDEVYKTGIPYIGKERLIKLDKEGNGVLKDYYFDFIYQPIFDLNNEIEGISTFAFDITDQVKNRKEIERLNQDLVRSDFEYQELTQSLEKKVMERTRELIESEKKYKALAESLEIEVQKRTFELGSEQEKLKSILMDAPIIIAILEGPEHIYTLSNPMYQKIVGNRNIVGKPIKEALPELAGQGLYEIMDEVYRTGIPFSANEYPVILDVNNDGVLKTVYFNFVYQPIFDINKKPEAVGIFAFDITEQVLDRKEVERLNQDLVRSEFEYQELTESLERKVMERTREAEYQRNKLHSLFVDAPAAICLLEGENHTFTFTNKLYEDLFGKDLVGKPIAEALPVFADQGYFDLLDNVFSLGEPFLGKQSEAYFDKGNKGNLQQYFFDFVYQPIYNVNKKIEGVSAFIYDVTDLVIAKKQAEELNKGLKRSNQELESFAHIASHDLQEPLRSVTSYSQLLAMRYKDKIDENANDYIGFIVAATKRMKLVIEDVLAHSKIQVEINDQSISDLNNIIDSVKSNLKLSLEENNVSLNYTNLPMLKANETYMIQLFQNLISNSIKYRKKDIDPVINISAEKKDNEWLISINDNGIGIDKKYYIKIFEIFRRLHRAEEYSGTGIGLASCKKIVELYGGKIWVESEEGQGSTFFFTIPIR